VAKAPDEYLANVGTCLMTNQINVLSAAGPVLVFSWTYVLALSVCGWCFPFFWLRPFRVAIL
jgi:hypothetical protein